VDTVTSGSRDWAQYYAEIGAKFIRMTNIPRNGIQLMLSNLKYVALPATGSEGARTSLQGGDILVSITAELGKIGIVPDDLGEAYINQHTALVRPSKKKVVPELLAQLLATKESNKRLNRLNDSGAKAGLNLGTVRGFKIYLPTLPEQKKIAAFLGVVDAKIVALRVRQAGLERYKRGLMQALFSQTLRFTKPDGTLFPDWEEKRLGEVFDWVRTNSLSRENLNYEGGETQNIHYGDIHTKFSATFRQSQERVPFVSAGAVPKGFTDEEFCLLGDVVIADASEDYADIGKVIEILELSETPLVAGLHTYIARPKGGLALGFSGYLLRSATLRMQIMKIAQGVSVLGISKTNLEKLVFELPHPEEQQKIADALSAMDAKIAAVSGQVTQMEAFKKGLLQQMFV
jgi:type I restriction enzyme S subunit